MSIETRYLHTLVVKRMAAVTAGGAVTVGGLATTLSADTAVGGLVLPCAAVGAVGAGDFLRVGDTGEREIREVASVLALDVTLTAELGSAHDSGDAVVQVDDAGAATVDDYSQPVMEESTVATVAGLIQPRSAREVAAASQAGAAIGNHVGYLAPLAGLTTADWIEMGGVRYDVVSIADAGGLGHHLELGLVAVT